jgi:hypothetical protein
MATKKTMASKPRKKRRRSLGTKPAALSSRRRSPVHHHAPRRRRAMRDGGIMKHFELQKNGAAALGGAVLRGANMVVQHLEKDKEKKSPFLKWGAAAAVVIGASMLKMPFVATGAAGALGYELAGHVMKGKGALNDNMLAENMLEEEFVPYDTLHDAGMDDENGQGILKDGDGHLYGMNDHTGEYEHIGHMDDYADVQGASLQKINPSQRRG